MTLTLTETDTIVQHRNTSLSGEIRTVLLEAFLDGDLAPGNRINDTEIANKLGVSRTPVREALHGLQALGLVEILPARVTRVATQGIEDFNNAKIVWASLYKVVITDALYKVTHEQIETMTRLGNHLTEDVSDHQRASTTFRFFNELSRLSDNTFLRESEYAAACRIRLGHRTSGGDERTHLIPSIEQIHNFLAAIIGKDAVAAHATLDDILELH